MGETSTLKPMEIDALGEVLNISLGSATTAVSNMLDARVTITAPKVSIKLGEEYDFGYMEPAISVGIDFLEGIIGKSLMVLKQSDARVILEMLLGYDIPEEEFVLDELALSALSEVMNQMMGSSATVLSEMLAKLVNISTPITESIDDMTDFKSKHLPANDMVIAVSFDLTIGDKVESEFIYLLSTSLSKNLVTEFLQSYGMEPEEAVEQVEEEEPVVEAVEEVEPIPVAPVQPEPVVTVPIQPQPTMPTQPIQPQPMEAQPVQPQPIEAQPVQPQPMQAQPVQPQPMQAQPMMQGATTGTTNQAAMTDTMAQMMAVMEQQMKMQMQMQEMQVQSQQDRESRKINAKSHVKPVLHNKDVVANYDANLDMIMRVPVEVSVEIGRTKKLIRDVLDLNKGSLVVLDKVAGESVDLYANGQLIARGDVVVVDDNFGIHVTEIISKDILGDIE